MERTAAADFWLLEKLSQNLVLVFQLQIALCSFLHLDYSNSKCPSVQHLQLYLEILDDRHCLKHEYSLPNSTS